MRNLLNRSLAARVLVGALAVVALAAAAPPVADLVFGQVRRSDGHIYIGGPSSDLIINGNVRWTSPDGGASYNPAVGLTLTKPVTCSGAAACGTVTLSSASPSTGTATVPAGVTCACFPVGTTAAIAAGGCAASVTSTTLTLTGPNTVTTVMRYVCWL